MRAHADAWGVHLMNVALLILLILINGAFAMTEMALAASRKARLQVMVESGEYGASVAMALHDEPTRFLSTVQIGITSIGLLNGIVGESVFAPPLSAWLEGEFGVPDKIAGYAATALVVVIITYISIVFGELVPKRIGQMFPETIARLAAPPMRWLSAATRPFVALLSMTTDLMLRILGLRNRAARSVTEEEIAASLEEGVDAGVIEQHEHQMVRNVFRLDERQIGSMMVPRAEISWLDADAPPEETLARIADHGFTRYPVCRGGLADVVGVVAAHRLVPVLARGERIDLMALVEPPVFVPETLSGMELLEQLRTSNAELVFVVDEYGEVQGVIALLDLLEAITGEFNVPSDDNAWAVVRDDGSWLLDGLIPVPEMKDRLALKEMPDEDRGRYNTLAGMVMLLLGRLPDTGDKVQWAGWSFEVVDMDGKRIDKVLAARLPEEALGA
jgi:putative hemolysin